MNEPGWPRPRLPYRGGTLPAPWVARIWPISGTVDPSTFDSDRIREVERAWKCQVCGMPCPQVAYAPVVHDDYRRPGLLPYANEFPGPGWEVSGGPVCSVRCCRLAVTHCPHLDDGAHLIMFDRADTYWWSGDEGMAGRSVIVTVWGAVPADEPGTVRLSDYRFSSIGKPEDPAVKAVNEQLRGIGS